MPSEKTLLIEHWMVIMVNSCFQSQSKIINSIFKGTILCYGQTGAGKTHTMTGFTESYQNRGIIPRTLQHLYQEINARQDLSFSVRYEALILSFRLKNLWDLFL